MREAGQVKLEAQANAFIDDLASDMEKRSGEIGARWAISPEAYNARVILERATGSDS